MTDARRCSRCQGEYPEGARFCPSCAQALTEDALEYPMSVLELWVSRVRGLLLPVLVFTVAALGVAVMVLASKLEHATHEASAIAARAAAQNAPNPNSALFPPAPMPAVSTAFPADVADYLRFLQQIEQNRVTLIKRKAALYAPPSPDGSSEPPPADPAAEWLALVRDFHTQPIPEACNPLAAEYGVLLNTTTTSGADTTALDAVAARTDTELDHLAQRYGVAPPFKIANK